MDRTVQRRRAKGKNLSKHTPLIVRLGWWLSYVGKLPIVNKLIYLMLIAWPKNSDWFIGAEAQAVDTIIDFIKASWRRARRDFRARSKPLTT